jgi:LPS export ABC transporter protein LptC
VACGFRSAGPACSGPELTASRDPTPAASLPTPQLLYEDITLTQAKPDGGLLWRLKARLAKYEPPPSEATPVQLGSAHLEALEGEFFDEDDRAVRVRAKQGSAYPSQRRLELRGQVEVESERDNLRLQAQRLEWLPAQRLLKAEGEVKVELLEDQGFLQGDRLLMDFGQGQMQVENLDPTQPVRAEYRELELAARRFLWQFGAGSAGAGSSRGVCPRQSVRLSGEELRAPLPLTELRLVGNAKAKTARVSRAASLEAQEIRWRIGSTPTAGSGPGALPPTWSGFDCEWRQGLLDWQSNTIRIQGNSQTHLTLP